MWIHAGATIDLDVSVSTPRPNSSRADDRRGEKRAGKSSSATNSPSKRAKGTGKSGKGKRQMEAEKKKKKKEVKKKKKSGCDTATSSSSSSSSSSSDDEESSASSGSTSSASQSPSSSGEETGKGKKKEKKGKLDMDLLEMIWPREDRPRKLQKARNLAGMSMKQLMKMQELYEKVQAKKGVGSAVFTKDRKPKAKTFKKKKDDGRKRLHPARWEGLPRVDPAEYWGQVPTTKTEVYRHLPLQRLGVEGVPESTIAKLHDRKVPVDLDMCRKEVRDMRQAQLAVCNYVTVMRHLHPVDLGGATIQIVLTEAGWGESLGDNEKSRLTLVKKFFEDCATENSGHAVRREPPMNYEQVRSTFLST